MSDTTINRNKKAFGQFPLKLFLALKNLEHNQNHITGNDNNFEKAFNASQTSKRFCSF